MLHLLIASILEIGWAVGLKYTEGWTKLWPSIITIVLMIGTYILLAKAVETIPLGTAYAIWTGIGAVGTAIFGMILFGEPVTVARIFCIVLIVAGIVGLKITS